MRQTGVDPANTTATVPAVRANATVTRKLRGARPVGLPLDLNPNNSRGVTVVRLELPNDPELDGVVNAEVKASVAAELRQLSEKAAKRLEKANKELVAATEEVTAARDADSVENPDDDLSGPLVDARNLSAPSLFAKLLPEFPAVQAASSWVFTTEKEWETARPEDARRSLEREVNGSLSVVREAIRHERELAEAVNAMESTARETGSVADQVRNASEVSTVDPGLLEDLSKLKGVALFMQEHRTTSDRALRKAEERYRDAARGVAEARLELRAWAGARDEAVKAQSAPQPLGEALWGEQKLEESAREWARAARRSAHVAERQHRAIAAMVNRERAATAVIARANASLSHMLKRAESSLEHANATLESAAEDYQQAGDLTSKPSPLLNASLHHLARNVVLTIQRERAMRTSQLALNHLQVNLAPAAHADEIAQRSAKTLAAAATQLRTSVQALEMEEADGEADLRARSSLLRMK
jgi:hypothetical protein